MPRPSWAQVPQAVMSSVMLLQGSEGPPKLCLTCDIFCTDFTAKCEGTMGKCLSCYS